MGRSYILEMPTSWDARKIADLFHKVFRFKDVPIELNGKFLVFANDEEEFQTRLEKHIIQWCYSFRRDVNTSNYYIATLAYRKGGTDEYEPVDG